MSAITKCKPTAYTTCPGSPSILAPIDEELLRFVFELREQGNAVSSNIISIKASRLLREFKEKSKRNKLDIVRRWTKHHSLVYRMGTHESSRNPASVANEAIDFIVFVARPLVVQPNRHPDYIINMDQTPVFFSFHSKKTLSRIGVKTVNIRTSMEDTKRITFAMSVTASGRVLKPYLIFKGKPGARIEKKELVNYPPEWEMFYSCQDAAWMDERVMLLWVELVLKPYVETAPVGIIPLLFLDSYRCHMMHSIVDAIQTLGVEVEIIPGGCTSLVQPVDIGVNKPFKNRLRESWEAWMVENLSAENTITVSPSRQTVAGWCASAYKGLSVEMVRNAWLHGNYRYFLPTAPTEEEANRTQSLLPLVATPTGEEANQVQEEEQNPTQTNTQQASSDS
jgi:hypothetical protein